jgi:hypothetical protein
MPDATECTGARRLKVSIALAAAVVLAFATPATAQQQTLIERDAYGRTVGKVETIVPGERWREADRYARTESSGSVWISGLCTPGGERRVSMSVSSSE